MVEERDPAYVERTGLALPHEGELVLPASGSEALLTAVRSGGDFVLEFPVQIEVRVVPACDPERHTVHTLTRLARALGARG